ncbi:MAG: shikimate kinase [Nautilia sp.]|nr:MAG: shikimate kinase [Nautilia sp.]
MLNKNIILIGFMGSGKSTIGRILVKKLEHSYFLDTDALIEHFENRKISDIFANEGEEYFRNAERRVFNWIKNDVKNAIISTGGGLPVFVPEIREAGIVIYLKVEFEDIVKRLNKEEIEKRPLFADLTKAKELFLLRDEIYMKLADYTIENIDMDDTLNKIFKIIKKGD